MYTHKIFQRIDLQANLKRAKLHANIPIETLNEEYKRLRIYFDATSTLLNDVKQLLHAGLEVKDENEFDNQDLQNIKRKINESLTELSANVNSYWETVLGKEHCQSKQGIDYLGYLNRLSLEVNRNKPDYEEVCRSYQNIIAKIAIATNQRKNELLDNSIRSTAGIIITENEKKRCTLV